MSIDICFDREMNILDEELRRGDIEQDEYNDAVRELERDYRELI